MCSLSPFPDLHAPPSALLSAFRAPQAPSAPAPPCTTENLMFRHLLFSRVGVFSRRAGTPSPVAYVRLASHDVVSSMTRWRRTSAPSHELVDVVHVRQIDRCNGCLRCATRPSPIDLPRHVRLPWSFALLVLVFHAEGIKLWRSYRLISHHLLRLRLPYIAECSPLLATLAAPARPDVLGGVHRIMAKFSPSTYVFLCSSETCPCSGHLCR
jgi:hypothetical protein